jgi:hypothetical protein
MSVTQDGDAGRMGGPEHYREAERLEAVALSYANDEEPTTAALHMAAAQVHATLALAAGQTTDTAAPPYPRLWVEPGPWGDVILWSAASPADELAPREEVRHGTVSPLVWERLTRGLPYIARNDDGDAEGEL